MASDGAAVNQKSRFAQNNTSFSSTSSASRRSNRVVSDELNVSSLNESTHMPKINPETQSNSPETHYNSPQSQSTGRNTQSSSPENHSTAYQRQSVARQMQENAPQPKSVGLQNEANSPPTRSNDTIQRGLRDKIDDSNDTNNTNDTDETDEILQFPRWKKKRGPTMGRGLMNALGGSKGKKMKIEVDPAIGRPKDRVESAKFSSQVGVVARDVLPVPRKWKEIDVQNALNPCIDHMQIHMDVNMDNPGQSKSSNRKKMRAKHITGQTPFTIIQNEINVNGKWSSDVVKENWELMMEKKEKYAEEGIEKSEQEIVTEVLGHANGYIKGLGYGPKPPGKRNSQLHKELEETRAELEESRTDKEAYKSTVDALTDQLKEQAAQIAKLMAFMQASGRNEPGGRSVDQ
ncbi:hypothetical protein CASFOL_001583 [Castilleja foliolosa]|uniref:Uncharacterized protein n=1 Tax=Castilleja foliolosa TaxID=1961234 RepID=A0ABD3EJM3_9LAMI